MCGFGGFGDFGGGLLRRERGELSLGLKIELEMSVPLASLSPTPAKMIINPLESRMRGHRKVCDPEPIRPPTHHHPR